jgi:hypothetical protein
MKEITVHDYVIGIKQLVSEKTPGSFPALLTPSSWSAYISTVQAAAERAREPGGVCNPIDFDKLRAAHYAANLG